MGFRAAALQSPDKPAIVMVESGETVSYGALSDRADQYDISADSIYLSPAPLYDVRRSLLQIVQQIRWRDSRQIAGFAGHRDR